MKTLLPILAVASLLACQFIGATMKEHSVKKQIEMKDAEIADLKSQLNQARVKTSLNGFSSDTPDFSTRRSQTRAQGPLPAMP